MIAAVDRAHFAPVRTAPGDARRLVESTLRGYGLDGACAYAALLTSELATNAVLHARESFTVTVQLDGWRARVEIRDPSGQLPLRRSDDLDTPGGRGLRIVDALAARWGVESLGRDGKVVCFEVTD